MRLAHIARATARATQPIVRRGPLAGQGTTTAPRRRFFDPEAKLDKMLLKYAHDILDKTPEEVKLRTMGPSGA